MGSIYLFNETSFSRNLIYQLKIVQEFLTGLSITGKSLTRIKFSGIE